MIQPEKRAALADERDTVLRDHDRDDDIGRDTELTRLDGEIKAMCTHDSISWNSRASGDGRIITTCERCDISWYEHAG